MKKLTLTSLLIVITLGFSSCSVEEDPLLIDNMSSKLFDKVTVKRDASGAYSLDMELNDGVGVDLIENKEQNRKDVNLYSTDELTKRNFNEALFLDGKESFQVGLNNTLSDNKSTLTIFDDDISFNKAANDDHLGGYEVVNQGEGTFDLKFSVDDNIDVQFIQNEDTGTYEVHLEPGDGGETYFERTLVKNPGEQLKIEFVNYYNDRTNKSNSETKPVIVWDPGEEEDND